MFFRKTSGSSGKSQGFVQEFVAKHISIVVTDSLQLFKKVRIHF